MGGTSSPTGAHSGYSTIGSIISNRRNPTGSIVSNIIEPRTTHITHRATAVGRISTIPGVSQCRGRANHQLRAATDAAERQAAEHSALEAKGRQARRSSGRCPLFLRWFVHYIVFS